MKERSCEVKYFKFHLSWLFIVLLISLIYVIVTSTLPEYDGLLSYIVIFLSIVFVPFIIYFWYRLIYFKKLQPSNVQEVVLEKVEAGLIRNFVRFIVEMDIDGKKIKVKTLPVFSTNFLGPNLVDYYSQNKALVGYDKRRKIAIVLKVIN